MSLLAHKLLQDNWVVETPSGLVNGSNTSYTLSDMPIYDNAVDIYLNGLWQEEGVDYTISGTGITFTSAPAAGQKLRAKYLSK